MLDIESVFTRFCSFAGLSPQEAAPWRPLCESSARLVEGRLREDADAEANMDRLCMAAALAAYNAYLRLSGKSSPGDEIRVGDITLKSSASGGCDALSHIADLLVPDGFAFVQTEVSP
jgi:hypothetical protein